MKNGKRYCQFQIEGNGCACKIQCKHCEAYYKPIETSRIPRKLKKKNNEKRAAIVYDIIFLCLAPDFANTNFPKENYSKKFLEKFRNLFLKSYQSI